MQHKYDAKIYFGEKIVLYTTGDDIEQLYVWMLSNSDKHMGFIHGEIIDNQSHEVVKKFKKDEEN
jgi:hypothetical protein